MPLLVEIGLLILCIGGTATLCVLAHAVLARVQQLARERPEDVEASRRHLAIKERELDLQEQEIANARRSLGLRERELVLEENEARDAKDDEGF